MAKESKLPPPSGGLMAVLPDQSTPWYKKGYLVKLNALILGLVCFRKDNNV
jgi:hypothetical protein